MLVLGVDESLLGILKPSELVQYEFYSLFALGQSSVRLE